MGISCYRIRIFLRKLDTKFPAAARKALRVLFSLIAPGSLLVRPMRYNTVCEKIPGQYVQGLKDLLSYIQGHIGKAGSMVEVGSYAGESTEIFATAFQTVYAVDPWAEFRMKHIEKKFDERAKRKPNIIKMKKFSADAASFFQDESLDFVYLDARHDYASVKNDIHHWLPKIKERCFIGGHDYNEGEKVGVIRAVDEMFGKPDKVFMDSSWVKQIG